MLFHTVSLGTALNIHVLALCKFLRYANDEALTTMTTMKHLMMAKDAALDRALHQGPSDHQVPRCEVCARETYALACRTCGLRICAGCELGGSQCVCYYWRDRQDASSRTRSVSQPRLSNEYGALPRMLLELLCIIVVGTTLTDLMAWRKRFSGHKFIDPPRRPPPPPPPRCSICGEFARVPFRYCRFCGNSPSWHHGRCCPARASDNETFLISCAYDNHDWVGQ